MCKVIAFIPVRGGSKSIPLKNIKSLCGKPLVWWVIEALQKCDYVTDIVVSTDSVDIENCVYSISDLSKVSVYKRSPETATDGASTESAMLDYLNNNITHFDSKDIFMLVQATSPLTTADDFRRGIEMFRSGRYTSVLSGVKNYRFHWSSSDVTHISCPYDYDFTNRPRRQDYQGTFVENGAFYISTVGDVLSSKCRMSGSWIGMCPMPEDTLAEIDEPSDWVTIERLMFSRLLHSGNKLPMPSLFVTDIDGTLTTGEMVYSASGKSEKVFNCKDGRAISDVLKTDILVVAVTTEASTISAARLRDLNVPMLVFDESLDCTKVDTLHRFFLDVDYYKSICAIGDDISDIPLLESATYKFCPSNASPAVKCVPGIIVLQSRGGEGCFAEMLTYFM